jgi:hypothetical protein
MRRYKYVHFSIALASCWSCMSAALGYMMSDDPLDVGMGVVLLLCQLVGAVVSVVVSMNLHTPSSNKFQLTAYIELTALITHSWVYAGTSVLALADPSLLLFLPWQSSDFSEHCGGYPTLDFFRVVVYLQSSLALVRCAALLIAQQSTSATFTSLIFSLGLLFYSLLEAVIKLKAERLTAVVPEFAVDAAFDQIKDTDDGLPQPAGDVEMRDTGCKAEAMPQEACN